MTADVADAEQAQAERQKATFEFACDGPAYKGVAVVNGHKVMNVTSFDVHADAESWPVVTLRLLPSDTLRLAFEDAGLIRFGDETREALVSLGWTPPPEGEACACGSVHPEGYQCGQRPPLPPGTECAP